MFCKPFLSRCFWLLCLCMGMAVVSLGQDKINTRLKHELDSVMGRDQQYREALSVGDNTAKIDSFAKVYNVVPDKLTDSLWKLQNRLDSLNLRFIEGVIKHYGYPGKSLVGEPANEAAWDVIQHSPKIDPYLPAIKKAADAGEIPYRLYAMMLDRYLINHNKEQIYGSQGVRRSLKSGKIDWIIWPVKDVAHVNELRKQAGFDDTIEANAQRLGIEYRVYRLSDLRL